MLEDLLTCEREAFLWLNSWHSPFTDQLMWLYSGTIAWVPLALCFIILLFVKNKSRWKEVALVMLAIVLVLTLCDQFSSTFCKPYFARLRPTKHPDFAGYVQTVFNYRSGTYGFISGHATNSFGFVTLTALIFRYRIYTVALYCWAFINAYSRIYLGVHFISDIIPGILAGLAFGWLVYICYKKTRRKIFSENQLQPEFNHHIFQGLPACLYLLLATFIIMLIVSFLSAQQWIPAITVK